MSLPSTAKPECQASGGPSPCTPVTRMDWTNATSGTSHSLSAYDILGDWYYGVNAYSHSLIDNAAATTGLPSNPTCT